MEKTVIELVGLTKRYGSVKAVDNLNLKVRQGEIFGLLGPNGAGKTTTILMMLGLSEPSEGKALICGTDATRHPVAVKRKVGYMPDNLGFYDEMSAIENLLYTGRLNGIPENEVDERARKTMELVGLGKEVHKNVGAYSRGMKQRLGLADVLLREPEVIILDEPTLGIDPSGIKEFLTLIRHLSQQKGLTVLLSSHHLHQVQQVCDRVGIFVGGHLLAEGNIEDLAATLFGEESVFISVSVRESAKEVENHLEELRKIENVKHIAVKDHTVELACCEDITPDIVRFFVQNGFNVTGVHKKEYGLDEIYHRYFENNLNQNLLNEKSVNLSKKNSTGKRKQ